MPRSQKPQASNSARKAHTGSGVLRLIGGRFRGRKLAVAAVEGLRPTPDRVRETLFNWLQFEVPEQRCLDLFAGSGALGFEALSRGAKTVLLVERDGQAARLLAQHADSLNQAAAGHGTALVKQSDALQLLQHQPAQPYDIVFLDPPFQQGLLQRSCTLLMRNGWLRPGSWIYLESELHWPAEVPVDWQLRKEKVAGQVAYRLYQWQPLSAEEQA